MDKVAVDQMGGHWQRLLEDIARGEPALITQDGQPLFMAVPMGAGLESPTVRLELAVGLFERGHLSIVMASRMSGLSISEMIDEFGKRAIPVVDYDQTELKDELEYVRSLTRRG